MTDDLLKYSQVYLHFTLQCVSVTVLPRNSKAHLLVQIISIINSQLYHVLLLYCIVRQLCGDVRLLSVIVYTELIVTANAKQRIFVYIVHFLSITHRNCHNGRLQRTPK